MHILVIGINYAPEKTGIGENTTMVCESLASRGHKISMITAFPHYPEWKVAEPYKRKIFMHEYINGVAVYRGYSCVPRHPTDVLQRIIHNVSFSFFAFLSGLTVNKIDLILAISPPLEGGIAAYVLSKIKKTHFVLQVKDLVPDLAISLGILRNPMVIKLAKIAEKLAYSFAERILVLCTGFVENIKSKGNFESKLIILSDWVDMKQIKMLERDNIFRHNNNLDGKFLVLHSGNMGVKQKLENVVEAAKYLLDLKDLIFVFAGEGPMKKLLQEKAKELPNVRFMPLQPNEMFPYMLSAADVLVLNQSAKVVDMVLPCKLLNYMSAGRPIVAGVAIASEASKYIKSANCGITVKPEQPQALAEAVRVIYKNRDLGERLGRNGRSFAEANFDKEIILKKYVEFFEKLVNN